MRPEPSATLRPHVDVVNERNRYGRHRYRPRALSPLCARLDRSPRRDPIRQCRDLVGMPESRTAPSFRGASHRRNGSPSAMANHKPHHLPRHRAHASMHLAAITAYASRVDPARYAVRLGHHAHRGPMSWCRDQRDRDQESEITIPILEGYIVRGSHGPPLRAHHGVERPLLPWTLRLVIATVRHTSGSRRALSEFVYIQCGTWAHRLFSESAMHRAL